MNKYHYVNSYDYLILLFLFLFYLLMINILFFLHVHVQVDIYRIIQVMEINLIVIQTILITFLNEYNYLIHINLLLNYHCFDLFSFNVEIIFNFHDLCHYLSYYHCFLK